MKPLRDELSALISACLTRSGGTALTADEVAASFEVPKEEKFGDLSTNVAMRSAKSAKLAPRPVADKIAAEIRAALGGSTLGERILKVTVEGPGFINFHYSPSEISGVLARIRAEGESFGRPRVTPKKILLEFVSANPTGPLTVAHGRQAALGDSLARILSFCGHQVTKEYYNNDEGVQINTLGASLSLRVKSLLEKKEAVLPENYYQGEYLVDIAKLFIETHKPKAPLPENSAECRIFARERIMEGIKKDLIDFDVHFDNFYSQEALGKSGKVEKTLEELKKRGVTKEEDGALWLQSTAFGDDKDRVLIKSDKNYTYLTPDIAYHHEKFLRGFDRIIDILGPDHHGYIARLKASQQALGHDPNAVDVLIAQLVTLYEGDKQVRMSTRAGEFITLRQILDEVGKDAGRFFFVMRKFDAHLDFDLELAKSQTPDNPVFYIQYAHARIDSIRRQAPADLAGAAWKDEALFSRLETPAEQSLLRLLSQYELNVHGAEKTLEPYRLVPYLTSLAAGFHRFYTDCRVVTDDAGLTRARLALCEAAQTVIRSGLSLLGVSAPHKM